MATNQPTREEITEWIAAGANDALRGHPPSADEAAAEATKFFKWGSETARRFNGAREALRRAAAKNDPKTLGALRGLRRDQSAVNESVIDATRGLLAVIRDLGAELDAVNAKLADLQMQLAEQRAAAAKAAPGCE